MADLLNNDLIHFEAVKAQRERALKVLKKVKATEKNKLKKGYKWIQTADKTWKLQRP